MFAPYRGESAIIDPLKPRKAAKRRNAEVPRGTSSTPFDIWGHKPVI